MTGYLEEFGPEETLVLDFVSVENMFSAPKVGKITI
jgi:hypothetical protein